MYAHAAAPVRIGIAGGGTDLPAWTCERTGRCISLAIKMYTHAVAIHRPDGQVVAAYRSRDVSSSATEIANGLIRESALMHGWETSFEVHTLSELSSFGSGLGVSSSIAVALAACFQKMATLRDGEKKWADLRNQAMEGAAARVSPNGGDRFIYEENPDFYLRIARDAWTVEIDRLRRPIGRQDQMAAAHGGLKMYKFDRNEAAVERVFTSEDAAWVAKHLLLIRLPEGHDSHLILSGVKNAAVLEASAVAVTTAIEAIDHRNVKLLGETFSQGQLSKNKIIGAVPPWLEDILAKLTHCSDIYGAKIAGAGGGGHIVVACEPEARASIERAIRLPVLAVEPALVGVRSEGWL